MVVDIQKVRDGVSQVNEMKKAGKDVSSFESNTSTPVQNLAFKIDAAERPLRTTVENNTLNGRPVNPNMKIALELTEPVTANTQKILNKEAPTASTPRPGQS